MFNQVKKEDGKFIFNLESACGLTSEQIVFLTIQQLKKRTKEFLKQIKKLKK